MRRRIQRRMVIDIEEGTTPRIFLRDLGTGVHLKDLASGPPTRTVVDSAVFNGPEEFVNYFLGKHAFRRR